MKQTKIMETHLLLIALWLLTFGNIARAQNNFDALDSLAMTFQKDSFPTHNALAMALVKNCSTDRDKARMIFTWIAKTVRYDWHKYLTGDKTFAIPYGKTLDEKQKEFAAKTYRGSKGICMDYSLLFREMCQSVGVECLYIEGQTRHASGFFRKWESHAWNAVKIDDKWQLIDVTWASGYINGGQFHRKFSDGYFFTPPELFVLDHFPNEEKWQLLAQAVDKQSFKSQPTINYALGDWAISAFEPKNGKLVATANGAQQIRLHFVEKPPAYITLKAGSSYLQVIRKDTPDGWTTLTFNRNGSSDVLLGVGKSKNFFTIMGQFE